MTLFRSPFQRRASSRMRKANIENTTQASQRKGSTRENPCSPETGSDIELREIFRQAAITTQTNVRSATPSKPQPSLFRKLIKRKEFSVGLDGLSDLTNQSIRPDTRQLNLSAGVVVGAAEKTRSPTPDIVSDGGYDSDAQFISSPRFSSRSWESLNALGFHPVEGRKSASSRTRGTEDKTKWPLSSSESIPLPNLERRRLPSLVLPKRRTAAVDPLDASSKQSHFTKISSVHHQEHEQSSVHATESQYVVSTDSETKSKFTELFNHGIQDATGVRDSTRKISIGWMSDGRRYGYGYSFVASDETDVAAVVDSQDCKVESTTEVSPLTRSPVIQERQTGDTKEAHHDIDELPSANTESTADTSGKLFWSSLPSHSKISRNQDCASFEDGVIVRDFCTSASPESQQTHAGDKQHHLIPGAIRQGISDAMLCVLGLGKREIARYHAGLDIRAARQYDNPDPQFETAIPSRSFVPKEELGNHHIEAWKVARRRSKQRRAASTKSQPPEVRSSSGAKVRPKRNVKSGSNAILEVDAYLH